MPAPDITSFGDGSHEVGETGLSILGAGFGAFPGSVWMYQNSDHTGLSDQLTVGAWDDLTIAGVSIPASTNNSAGTVYLFVEREDLALSQAFEFTLAAVVVPPVEDSPSGGFYTDFHPVLSRGRRKRLEELIDEIKEESELIPDKTESEISKLLRIQEAKDEERAELSRLQSLADHYAKPGVEVPRPVLASVMKANEERTKNALEQMRREIERMIEDEEQAVIAMLLLED